MSIISIHENVIKAYKKYVTFFVNIKDTRIDGLFKKREGYNNTSHSEIEVAQYQIWSPETIEQRGLKLLSFMEERWGIPIENEQKKKELLFLGGR